MKLFLQILLGFPLISIIHPVVSNNFKQKIISENNISQDQNTTVKKVLYAEGKHPNWLARGVPYIYVTFSDTLKGMFGAYDDKGGYLGWTFNFNRINDSLYEGLFNFRSSTIILPSEFAKISLHKIKGQWFSVINGVGYSSSQALYPYMEIPKNEEIRKEIYFSAKHMEAIYELRRKYSWKNVWLNEYLFFHRIVGEKDTSTLFQLPYEKFCARVDKNWLDELTRIKNINTFNVNGKFVLFEKNSKSFSKLGVIYNSQKLFNLLKQAHPIEKPKEFVPQYSIQIQDTEKSTYQKYGKTYNFGKKIFCCSDDNYWYEFDRDVSHELLDLIK